jgi:DNA-binding NtrC family response regulator
MSVLIVEDEPLIRMELVEDVARAGFDVLDAGDASGALELLSENQDVAVLFTDVNMPGDMDGLELAKVVSEQRPAVAVILTSACALPAADVLPPGGRFVPKPYDPDRVIEILRDAAGRARRRRGGIA